MIPINHFLASELITEKWRCSRHSNNYNHLLHLNINSKAHKICQECQIESNIPDKEILSILDLLESDESTFFTTFPVLIDPNSILVLKKLLSSSDDVISQQKQISPSQKDITHLTQNNLKFHQLVIKSLLGVVAESKKLYQHISQINKLKQAVLSEAGENELHSIIVSIISQSTANSLKINRAIQRLSRIIQKLDVKVMKYFSYRITKTIQIIQKIGIKYSQIYQEDLESLCFRLVQYKNVFMLELDIYDDGQYHLEFEIFYSTLRLLNNLKQLELQFNCSKIIEQGTESICLALSQLTNLNSLQLNFNFQSIGENGAELLSKTLNHFKYLNCLQLRLYLNNIREQGALSLSQALSLQKNLNLLSLNLNSNSIGSKGVKSIFSSICSLTNLNYLQLELQNNQIAQKEASLFFSQLTQLKNLHYLKLNLNKNDIRDKGAESISEVLCQIKNLSTLKLLLSLNKIGIKGIESISSALNKLHHLNHLQLELKFSKLDEKGTQLLSTALSQLTNLSTLQLGLSWNEINNREIESFISVLSKLVNLLHQDIEQIFY